MTKNFIDDALEFFPSKGFTVKRTGRDQAVVLKDGLPYVYLQPRDTSPGYCYHSINLTKPVDRTMMAAFSDFVKRPRLPAGWDDLGPLADQRTFWHGATKTCVFTADPLNADAKKALADLNAYLGT